MPGAAAAVIGPALSVVSPVVLLLRNAAILLLRNTAITIREAE
ncbi:hypothetical protein SAMN05444123_101336 [Rhodopseudomonas pseudopalustris]|uniref:Uncharacterized protein n=2 Tax=Rhodopseudomonas pseudopalustris TaxID=1513892 RepID=A0A1H8M2F1_9BRAD|nr:hypothetical protein SAMN05444123_101336 [Rhodopseudomonas pseudopalustris]